MENSFSPRINKGNSEMTFWCLSEEEALICFLTSLKIMLNGEEKKALS